MSELEKKLSDFQKSECEEINSQAPQQIDVKACPTCTPDPNFVAPIWWEETDAFLDKRFCEYHVRVYSSEVERTAGFQTSPKSMDELFERVIDTGITKILRSFDKPINNPIREVLRPAAYKRDEYQNLETSQLGIAYLVAIPAFNFDQISQDVDESGDNQDPEIAQSGEEIILNVDGLNRKLRQLRLALNTYKFYYATTRSVSKDFVIRQEADVLKRINYESAISQVLQFKRELNEALSRKNITRIDRPGFLRAQRAEKIKIVFKESDRAYDFKSMLVLTDRGCSEYEKLNVPQGSVLRSPSMSLVYNFLRNLDSIINDITAKETKPWLDFTLEYFYPAHIVDYGGISDLSEQRKGIECLIELELGIGNGQIIDSLTDEIISAFNKIGDDFAQQACRSIQQVSSKGPIAESTKRKEGLRQSASLQREETMVERYKNEFINKFYDYVIPELSLRAERKIRSSVGGGEELFDPVMVGSTTVGSTEDAVDDLVSAYLESIGEVTRENIFEKWDSELGNGIDFFLPTYKYISKDGKRQKITANQNVGTYIYNQEELIEKAKQFANEKFHNLEGGSVANQVQNSPFLDEVKLAKEELVQGLGKTYVDGAKEVLDRAKDIDPIDFITSIGVCGVSKMAGKAMECIAAGATFEQFMDLVLEKVFDFMTLNTLHLFFNGLPADFKTSLDEAIAEQFGADANLSDLFGLVLAAPESSEGPTPETKVTDITKSKLKVKEIQALFEKFEDPFIQAAGDERRMLIDQLGNNRVVFDQIIYEMSRAYNRSTKQYYEDIELQIKVGGKFRKPKRHIRRYIKTKQVDYKSGSQRFQDAKRRISSALGKAASGTAAAATGAVDAVTAGLQAANEAALAAQDFVQDRQRLSGYRAQRSATENALDVVNNRLQVLESRKTILEDQIESAQKDLFLLGTPQSEDQSIDPFELGYQAGSSLAAASMASTRRDELEQQISDATQELQQINNEISDVTKQRERFETELVELQRLIDEIAVYDDVVEGVSTATSNIIEGTQNAFNNTVDAVAGQIVTIDSQNPDEAFNQFEEAQAAVTTTALGVKVDIVFDLIFDFVIDKIFDYFTLDELFERIQNYPMADVIISKVKDFFVNSCPIEPMFVPSPADFMKTLSLDVCNLDGSLTLPKMFLPSIDWKFALEQEFGELFREAIIQIITEVIVNLLKKLLNIIEGSLCKLLEAAGGLVVDAAQDGNLNQIGNRFVDALDEAFCNSGENPDTARKRAEELADALFSPLMVSDDADFEGSGAKAANVISSVASKDEILEAIVATQSTRNRQFEKRISNAVNILAPELSPALGDPDACGSFFMVLGSFLPVEDKNRIRELLDAGVPEQPISAAICLTDDQLEDWNSLRERLLADPSMLYVPGAPGFDGDDGTGRRRTPEEIVRDLNNKTQETLGDLIGDIANLASDGGPFLGAITNEALKDVCNPNNLLNDVSMARFEREIEDEEVDALYENLSKILMMGFTFKGGLFAEALRDKEDRREFFRQFIKLFNPNYGNSQAEQDIKFNSKGVLGKFLMNTLGEDNDGDNIPDVQGDFPETVAITQRKELLESDEGRNYNFDQESNVTVYKYAEGSEEDDFLYNLKVRANNALAPGSFDYRIRTVEETYEDKALVPSFFEESNSEVIMTKTIPMPLSETEMQFLEDNGIQIDNIQSRNLRKEMFNSLMKKKVPINKGFRKLYNQSYRYFNKMVSQDLLTNYDNSDNLPFGYKYGYVSETLSKEDFTYYNKGTQDKYDRPESAKELGEFANKDRIIALSPEIYGGRYSNPPFYIEPRQYTGWLELATKSFESVDGCDPQTPPLLSFRDIQERVKTLNRSIKNDPRLAKDRDCVSIKPFNVLLDSKNKAALEGVVRTTLRTYLAEFYFTGYGLFSNLQLRPDNFDNSLSLYIAEKMKKEMSDIGTFTSNRKIRIVRERYWYTFLEQCVEVYQRMIDLDGLEPPEEIYAALNEIQLALDAFRPIGKKRRREMRKTLQSTQIQKPQPNFDRLNLLKNDHVSFNLQSVAFRLSSEEEREDFFNGEIFDKVNANDIRFASIKKLRFFQKIYFIKMFEKEAIMIMSEMIKTEVNRLNGIIVDGLRDKPYYFDLSRSLFAMKGLFSNSQSRVGLSDFYLKKQIGQNNPGNIPDVNTSRDVPIVSSTEEPQFIIEKYLRLGSEKSGIRGFVSWNTRPNNLRGVVSLNEFVDFVEDKEGELGSSKFSDFFGDLEFIYQDSLRRIFERGNTSSANVSKLKQLNPELEDEISRSLVYFFTGATLPSEEQLLDTLVQIDSSFIGSEQDLQPIGTTGELGVKYGLRVSIVAPQDFFTEAEVSQFSQNIDLITKGELEKAYMYDDGTFILPILESEVDVIDTEMVEFNPFTGENSYDLECLINKMVASPEYKIIIEKCFNLKQISSMVGIFCIETLPASIGRDETERNEVSDDPDVDTWDRTINRFAKNHLRRQFKSHYLAGTADGDSVDDDDDRSLGRLLSFSNPFDFDLSIKLPWWKLRRQRFKIYDANGIECADPKKDLQ